MSPDTRRPSRTRPSPGWPNCWTTSTAGPDHRACGQPEKFPAKTVGEPGTAGSYLRGVHLGTGGTPGAYQCGGDALGVLLCTAVTGKPDLVLYCPDVPSRGSIAVCTTVRSLRR